MAQPLPGHVCAGSTDNTVQIVEEFFDKKSIPGLAATHPWQDFGHNRNLCIQVSSDAV